MKCFLTGEDTFLHSTPQEVETFKEFVSRTSPYDVVVDGLNIGFQHVNAAKKSGKADHAKTVCVKK